MSRYNDVEDTLPRLRPVKFYKELADGSEVSGVMEKKWVPLPEGKEVACGVDDEISFDITKRNTVQNRIEIRNRLRSSVGAQGLAQVESEVEVVSGLSITDEEEIIRRFSEKLIAPRCGRQGYQLFRQDHIYRLTRKFKQFGIFKRDLPIKPFRIRTKIHTTRIAWEDEHPNCPCDHPKPRTKSQKLLMRLSDSFSVWIDAYLVDERNIECLISGRLFQFQLPERPWEPWREALEDLPEFLIKLLELEGSSVEAELSLPELSYPSIGVAQTGGENPLLAT